MNVPSGDVIKLPMEKDMTDSEAAIDLAVSKGYKDITLLGAGLRWQSVCFCTM